MSELLPLPLPLTPPQADLTDFAFMPLQVARLRASKSWLICKRRPDVAFFMLNLWTSAWHERPAGSLEDDDDVLADRAMCSPYRWPEVKADALRGWVKCSDGRLYHPVVAEVVGRVWQKKQSLLARMNRRLGLQTEEWQSLRSAVFARDDYRCQYCSTRGGRLECDHIQPVSRGGLTILSNLVTACRRCNRSKGKKLLAEWVPA